MAARSKSGPRKFSVDVLGLGCVAVDDLIYVQAYPPADAKVTVSRTARQCGGLTATALVAAARLGASCAYAGILGRDELSEFAIAALRREKIDLQLLVQQRDARPVHSVIVVDERAQTRNVFCDIRAAAGAHPTRPPSRFIRSARVVLIDAFGIPGMLRAARLARHAGLPLVGDFERAGGPGSAELFGLVDHLIISDDYAKSITGRGDPAEAALALWDSRRNTVIVTAGREGCWSVDQETAGTARHYPAFVVKSVDTTGCGDVFHGAYAAALAWQWPLHRRLRYASAAAALKATRRGGQQGAPTGREVDRFLKRAHVVGP